MPARKIDHREKPVTDLVKIAGVQPLVLGSGTDGSAIVNLDTGEVAPIGPPGAKLNDAGKMRLIQLIAAGAEDKQIAEMLVNEGYVLSYTHKAVAYWRERPEVQQFTQLRWRRAFQVGLASKERRVEELGELALILKEDILSDEIDPNTGRRKLRSVYINDEGKIKPVSKQSQMIAVKEFRETIAQIGMLVDEPAGKTVDINMNGNVSHTHAALFGVDGLTNDQAQEKLKAMAQEAVDFIEGELVEEEETPSLMQRIAAHRSNVEGEPAENPQNSDGQ